MNKILSTFELIDEIKKDISYMNDNPWDIFRHDLLNQRINLLSNRINS